MELKRLQELAGMKLVEATTLALYKTQLETAVADIIADPDLKASGKVSALMKHFNKVIADAKWLVAEKE